MFTKHTLIYSLALLASVFLLTGCPPPPDLTQWQRPLDLLTAICDAGMTSLSLC
ncbi:TPA: hypothetical protein ACPZFU_003479 [Yersinia enterocolitica]|uniref:hypothetical protein n=1 Tax=Yersinia enterocolitica TaxID=630 RepID=UPI0005EA3F35|nr:hypothetical protein [Yersinia enterocolitica]EKN3327799.1 hypothetical protein [Yersinia enterocolitica]EKN3352011.1 hypothetical protein [Yersinia enterocolitica]EKN3359865.1 hypothetical protein [Yersinia enterocolitica]EKN3366846.1 hypothetical protein [Yersinia enterocolitica]EKN3383014.1 hypothetical protein [Yersinia enterocolitica]